MRRPWHIRQKIIFFPYSSRWVPPKTIGRPRNCTGVSSSDLFRWLPMDGGY